MERHKLMYKSNTTQLLSPRVSKYQKAKKEWASKRNDTFQLSRMLPHSPSEKTESVEGNNDEENKDPNTNTKATKAAATVTSKASTSKAIANANAKPEKKSYLERFSAWKKEKELERERQRKLNQRKPFVTAASNSSIASSSFAPKNHVFKAPSGLKDPTARPIGKQSLRSHANPKPSTFVFVEPAKPKPKAVPQPRQLPNYLRQTVQLRTDTKPRPMKPPAKPEVPKRVVKANPVPAKVKPAVRPPVRPNAKKSPPKKTTYTSNYAVRGIAAKQAKLKSKPPVLKLNNRPLEISIVETPTEKVNLENTEFSDFVTSTRRKSSSFKKSLGMLVPENLTETISPIDVTMDVLSNKQKPKTPRKSISFIKKKGGQIDPEPRNNTAAGTPGGFKFTYFAEVTEPDVQLLPTEEVTPPKSTQAPANYMSPFVSVSRGKVNSRTEKEKRNSIYLTEAPPVAVATSFNDSNADYRRTMESVRYFRQQLTTEINRMHCKCDEWDAYKSEHGSRLEEFCVDMINVAIGQTKLLTSKKLNQFSGLIDKCELGALERKNGGEVCEGTEEGKPILSEDLEGFWSMVGLQIENVDKRFENLKRWREHNWCDPDEVKVKTKKKLTKVTKSKARAKPAKANSALQEMLKKAHAAYKQSKATQPDEDIIMTPTKRRSVVPKMMLSTPRRRSMAVLSRASISRRSTSTTPKIAAQAHASESEDKLVPEMCTLRKSLNLLKTAFMNEYQRRGSINVSKTPPNNANKRKSILKTPGTRGKTKNVIFNEQLHFKSPEFKFTEIESDGEYENPESNGQAAEPEEIDRMQRSYRLRTRRIVKRESCEIVIPK